MTKGQITIDGDGGQTRDFLYVGNLCRAILLGLEQNARLILTDSGGMQKEAYFFGVPCVTLRPETEWVETVEAGWNVVVSDDNNRIADIIYNFAPPVERPLLFGDGQAAKLVIDLITRAAL